MKQILQNLGNGETSLEDVPPPTGRTGSLLIQSSASLVSSGTERMVVDFGKANLLDKARLQPDKVKMVLEKIRTDGLGPTIETVRNKLDQPLPLGYCNVGSVLGVGSGIDCFQVGDRVASNGHHAEVVRVPGNLCVKVPDNVSDESAAFTVLGAIALQGIRLVQPTLGEAVVVTGLGLIGLMTVQLLRAQGCRVMGIDLDPKRIALARQFGAECVDLSKGEDPLNVAKIFSRGRGVDAVLITASTESNEPVSQAANMCRKRGQIVLVGVTGLELSRADFFEKELSFQVSCSYGPGRYDPEYEDKGHDYPVGFVRWTEQRNMEAVLDMMASGALNVEPLVSHRFKLEDGLKAYDLLLSDGDSLGILLGYPGNVDGAVTHRKINLVEPPSTITKQERKQDVPTVGFIGAGNYAGQILIPAFKEGGAVLRSVASSSGVSGVHFGKKHGFELTTTDSASIFSDDEIDTVVVATRHDSHAQLVLGALKAGKHVFVEKPLCLTMEELTEIESVYTGASQLIMVGFNRRFAPQVQKINSLLKSSAGPKSYVMTVNAGSIPGDHWTQDGEQGGGRIVGEACHFVDLLRFLADAPITESTLLAMDSQHNDTAAISLKFANGSLGTIHFFANGNKSFPKERLEVFSSGRILQLDNFRKLTGFGWPGFKKQNLYRQDKGQINCVNAFVHAIKEGGESPIPFNEIVEVSRVCIELANQ